MLVILFRLLALCLTAPEKWKNFTGSPFGFLFHDSGYRESFLQVPKAHVSVRTLLIKHVWFTQRLLCGRLECPNFDGLFTSEATWHYTWNLTPKRWISFTLREFAPTELSIWYFQLCTHAYQFVSTISSFSNSRNRKCPPLDLLWRFVFSFVSKYYFKTLEKRGNVGL